VAIHIDFAKAADGTEPVLNHLQILATLAGQHDPDASWILPRIRRALDFAKRYGVPAALYRNEEGLSEDGIPYTLAQPVKALDYHPPIHEIRVNKQGYGAFRALFFPYEYEGDQILVFTFSVLKAAKSDPAFDAAIAATEAMLPDFEKDPGKYITL
jgi:hypothetical protein